MERGPQSILGGPPLAPLAILWRASCEKGTKGNCSHSHSFLHVAATEIGLGIQGMPNQTGRSIVEDRSQSNPNSVHFITTNWGQCYTGKKYDSTRACDEGTHDGQSGRRMSLWEKDAWAEIRVSCGACCRKPLNISRGWIGHFAVWGRDWRTQSRWGQTN